MAVRPYFGVGFSGWRPRAFGGVTWRPSRRKHAAGGSALLVAIVILIVLALMR
jgi:hypothetical protein